MEVYEVAAAGPCAARAVLTAFTFRRVRAPAVLAGRAGRRGRRRGGGGAGRAAAPGKPPVVVLSSTSSRPTRCSRPDGHIDAARYPNFAALARHSTWFRERAHDLRLDLQGGAGDPRRAHCRGSGTAPDVRSHQPSIFHLMDRLGYDVIKVESGTALCPPRICPGARTRRPGVLKRLAGGGRPARLHKWIGAIRDRPRPTFYLQHALLPHEPWIYLPSGHQSRPSGNDPIEGINRPEGFHDPALTDHNHLRHLLQVGYVDRQLGLLIARHAPHRAFDRALLVVVADHGIAFEVGVKERRQVTRDELRAGRAGAVLREGARADGRRSDDGLVRNLDVVPTVADLLGTRGLVAPRRPLGVLAPRPRGATRSAIPTPRLQPRDLRSGRAEFERAARRAAARRAASTAPARRASCCSATPGRRLPDRPAPGADRAARGGRARWPRRRAQRARSPTRSCSRDVDPREADPAHAGDRPLDGGAAGRAARPGGGGQRPHRGGRAQLPTCAAEPTEFFSLIVPETALRPGRNAVELFEVRPGGRLAALGRS